MVYDLESMVLIFQKISNILIIQKIPNTFCKIS